MKHAKLFPQPPFFIIQLIIHNLNIITLIFIIIITTTTSSVHTTITLPTSSLQSILFIYFIPPLAPPNTTIKLLHLP